MEELVEEAVREIEEEQALNRKSGASVFRSMLNQPALVSISSANANLTGSSEAFSEFRVNLPRPILQVESLQLLNINIPECTQNIPDTACVFWYYRLNPFMGLIPNALNLYMVRLLPSYYKPEFGIGTTYGFNHTFFDYQEVADELVKSGQIDLAYDNLKTIDTYAGADQPTTPPYFPEVPFSPNDVEITFDPTLNKFQMTGMNAYLPLISYDEPATSTNGNIAWSSLTTYALGSFVTYAEKAYRSLQAGNLNNTPPTGLVKRTAYWALVQTKEQWVRTWNNTTYFPKGIIVYYTVSNTFWYAKRAAQGNFIPTVGSIIWEPYVVPDNGVYNRYLITGYDDPNVLIRQATQIKTWNPYNTFQGTDWGISTVIQHEGALYQPYLDAELVNCLPFKYPIAWSSAYNYVVGDLTESSGIYYEATAPSLNKLPSTNALLWRIRTDLVYSLTANYTIGSVVLYSSRWYYAIQASINQPPSTAGNEGFTNAYWIPQLWQRDFSGAVGTQVGLNAVSSRYDMLDQLVVGGSYEFFWNFPSGIPGQPFNPLPKRLLNSILGFTWNGQFAPTDLTAVNEFSRLANNTVIQLYNRLRPVPPYVPAVVAPTIEEIVYTSAINTQTFTANGYANLVYTSVVSVYGSIAGARTLDSQRDTSLLGLVSMNADNLGIGFYGNYIESGLQANGEDLYTISIQMFDEFNEPFVLTNNAVVSLTFKMTYKNK